MLHRDHAVQSYNESLRDSNKCNQQIFSSTKLFKDNENDLNGLTTLIHYNAMRKLR